jgi:flagellar protein FlgJ
MITESGKTGQVEPSRSKRGVSRRTAAVSDDRLKKACADFEGIFLNLMVQTMRKSIPEGGVFGKTHQSDMYDTLFLQEISIQLARERGLGIGDALYRQVRRQMIETAETNSPGSR